MKNHFRSLEKVKLTNLLMKVNLDRQLIVIICFILLVVSNILVGSFSVRLDLSKGNAYTLSPATKKILHSLDDVVNIKFFVSSDLPSRLLPVKNDVNDLLNEYKKESKNKIVVKVLDPKKDPTATTEVKELGIPELQFSQLEKNKYQLSNAYFGMAILFGDKKEILAQATDLANLEYNTTSLIYKLTKKELSKVGIISMNEGVNQQNDPYALFNNVLNQQYDIQPIDLTSSDLKEIDSSYKTLVLTDTKKKYEKEEIEKIKKYVANKGKIVFLVDGVWVNDNLTTQESGNNLFPLLEEWGISLHKNFVLSTSAEFVNFGNNLYQFFTPYPFWVKTNNFSKNSDYFSNVSSLTFPWTSSVSINPKKTASIKTLVSSPKKSWEQKESYDLYPQNIKEPQPNEMKEYPLVVQADTKEKGTVVVIPSSRFLNMQYLSKESGNIDFIFNLINNLASNGALSGIRSRSVSFYPIPDIPDNQKDIVKYLNILLIPSLFGIYGLVRILKRR